jgi:hypothetical protein
MTQDVAANLHHVLRHPSPRRAGRKPRTPSSDGVRDQGWERISSIWERRLPILNVTGCL